MAGDDVSLSPDELRNNARHVEDFASRFDSLTQQILSRANSEDGKWGGSKDGQQFAGGGNGYIAQLKWVSGVFDGQSKTLHSFSDTIRDTADTLEQQDDDDSAGQNGSPSGISNGGNSGSGSPGSASSRTTSNPNKTKSDQPNDPPSNQPQQPSSEADSAFATDSSGQSSSPSGQQEATAQPASSSGQPASSQPASPGPSWGGGPVGPPITPAGQTASGQATAAVSPLSERSDTPVAASNSQPSPPQPPQQPNQGVGQSGAPPSGGSPRSTPPASSGTPPPNLAKPPKHSAKSANSVATSGAQGPFQPNSAAAVSARPAGQQPGRPVSAAARSNNPDHATGTERDRQTQQHNTSNEASPSSESADDSTQVGRSV